MFFKTGVSRNFPIFTGKHVLDSLFNKSCKPYGLQLYLKESLTQVFSCEYHEIFTKNFFDRKPPVASVDLLFLTKSNVGWFLLTRVDLVIVRVIHTLLVETIVTRFYWLICRNQKLLRRKPLQQRLYVLILGFWQCRLVFVHYMLVQALEQCPVDKLIFIDRYCINCFEGS